MKKFLKSIIWGAIITIIIIFLAQIFYFNKFATYTLYRNSVLDKSARIHIATFDSEDRIINQDNYNSYNKENCQRAAILFQPSEASEEKYWCEKGKFKK